MDGSESHSMLELVILNSKFAHTCTRSHLSILIRYIVMVSSKQ